MANLFTKKLKPAEEMMRDPDFHLRIGRLVGAAEMAGHVLTHTDNAQQKFLGEQLAFVADWFFVTEKGDKSGKP